MEAEEGGGQGGAGARREELAASSKRGAPQHKGSRPAGARHRRSWQQISSKLGSRGEERGEVLGTTSARRATTQVRRSCAVIALCSFHFVGRWGLVCFCGFRQAVCRPSGMCVCVSFCRHSPFWPQQSSKHGYQNMLFADTVLLDPASRASKVIKHFVLQTRPSADPLSRTGPLAHPEAGLFSTPFLHNPLRHGAGLFYTSGPRRPTCLGTPRNHFRRVARCKSAPLFVGTRARGDLFAPTLSLLAPSLTRIGAVCIARRDGVSSGSPNAPGRASFWVRPAPHCSSGLSGRGSRNFSGRRPDFA